MLQIVGARLGRPLGVGVIIAHDVLGCASDLTVDGEKQLRRDRVPATALGGSGVLSLDDPNDPCRLVAASGRADEDAAAFRGVRRLGVGGDLLDKGCGKDEVDRHLGHFYHEANHRLLPSSKRM